ncbi:MAG: dienelactone hydrolase family protein [Candidatus Omnitrophica bacterium]|nr:dienelactone hydrolase family protein [Candidatus Omnitrophota bacterium]
MNVVRVAMRSLLVLPLVIGAGHGMAFGIEHEEILYPSGGLRIKGSLCTPEGPGPFPAVIYNHGGRRGAIGGAPVETCEALAEAGFVGFAPVLRTDMTIEESLEGVLAAVDDVKGLAFADPRRIGIIGFSRGGLLTLMAATRRSDVNAIVLMAPAPGQGHLDRVLPEARQITAPVLLMVSENDRSPVDHVQVIRKIQQALESAGQRVKLIRYPPYGNDGHQMFFKVGDYWNDVLAFFKDAL